MLTLAGVLKFFLDSRLGQSILLAAVLALGVTAGYEWAYHRGVRHQEAVQQIEQAKANVKAAQVQAKRDATSSQIAAGTATKAATEAKTIDTATNTAKETIKYVYVDKPVTQAVAHCVDVHPLDSRVQHVIDDAVNRANAPAGKLQATGN